MKTLLLSIFALSVALAPVFGEDQDEHKPKNKSQTPPAPHRQTTNNVPRSFTPKVQQQLNAKTQASQNRQNVNRTYTPKTYTPNANVQNRNRNFTPVPDQDAPRTVTPKGPTVTNNDWQNRKRNWNNNNNNVVTQTPSTNTTTTANTNPNGRNRNWNNNNNPNRNWSNNNTNQNRNRNWNNNNTTNFTYEQARRNHHRNHHDRSWWRSHYSRIALFAGGYYFWNSGYWYPAYGYDPYYSNYTYDEPIYGGNSDLDPGQVIANVQSALQEQGYYNGEVDGLIGPNTRAALRNFQADNGLPVTAAIDGPTLQALGLN
jgi:hypothetical protein